MAYNIAANQRLAQPVSRMNERQAVARAGMIQDEELRLAKSQDARAEAQLALNERASDREDIKLDLTLSEASKPPELDPNKAAKVMEIARQMTADNLSIYDYEKAPLGEDAALERSQQRFERNRNFLSETFKDYVNFDPNAMFDPESARAMLAEQEDPKALTREQKIAQYAKRDDVIAHAAVRGVTPLEHATDIEDGNFVVSDPDSAGRIWGTYKTTGETIQLNQVLPEATLRESVAKVKELEGIVFEAEDLEGYLNAGETFGPGNILQRWLQTGAQILTAPVGGWFDTAFLDERLGRDAMARFNQRARAAFVNSNRFPQWEVRIVEPLLLDPNEFSLGDDSSKVKFLSLVTYSHNRIEEERAFQEGRDPVRVQRPRLGTEYDPLVFPSGTSIDDIFKEYPEGTWVIHPESGQKGVVEHNASN